jgi:enoyl-CoA hydratase
MAELTAALVGVRVIDLAAQPVARHCASADDRMAQDAGAGRLLEPRFTRGAPDKRGSTLGGMPIDTASYEHVRLSFDGRGILTATMTNPEKRNAMTAGIGRELDRLWREADEDPDVRVIVLTGAGNAFCAGVDLGGFASGANQEARTARRGKGGAKGIRTRVFDILDCETPTIAKVRGPAYGMGVNIALACDFVIAADDARLCDSHVKNGIAAGDGGIAFYPLMVGFRKAKELLMLGDVLSGTEAADIGLINKAVPGDDLDAEVEKLAVRICHSAPLAIGWTKASLNIILKQMTLGAFETSIAYDLYSLQTNDVREGSAAFMEKRPPDFTGN